MISMHFRSRLLPCFLFLFLSTLALTVPFSTVLAQEKDTLKKAPEAKSPSDTAPTPGEPCGDLFEKIQKFYHGMPTDFGSIPREDVDKLAAETEKIILSCLRFEASCSSYDKEKVEEKKEGSPKKPKLGEVYLIHAKLLYILSERQRYAWMLDLKGKGNPNVSGDLLRLMKGYMGDVARLAALAAENLPSESPLNAQSLQLTGQAWADSQEPQKARQAYEKLIETYPTYPEMDKIQLALARACLDMEDFDRGIEVVNRALKEQKKSNQFAFFVEVLWKLCHSKGDLSGMEKVTQMVETAYPLKLTNTDLSRFERENYERFLGFNGFRKGYTFFARGDFVASRSAFTDHVAQLDTAEKELAGKGQELKPELKIYRQRSLDNLKFLDKLVGLPPPSDFDLGNAWATKKKLTLSEARGKVVGIVFRGVGDERSASFLGPVSQYASRQPDMEMVVIAYLKASENVEQQAEALREELSQAGYEGAAGFDPDGEAKRMFRAFQVNVGTATFLILNRRGELVWFMQDPRGVDVHFAQTLLKQWADKP